LSQKHNQRTRAEILRLRGLPIDPKRLNRDRFGAPISTPHAMVRKASLSKYTPHTGAKEVERAKRCRMDFLHGPHAVFSDNERSAPTLCQLSKVDHEQQTWQREYDSECVF
jgi:hypothetical protein